MKIGIDFGTCFSFISTIIGNNIRTALIEDDYKETGVPTLFYHDGQNTCCGKPAMINGLKKPEYFVSAIKRDLKANPGRANVNTSYTYKNTGYTGEQIVETYITFLIEMAKSHALEQGLSIGKTVDEVVITAPDGYDVHGKNKTEGIVAYRELLRRVTKKVTKLPDNKISIIGEPEAAAMYYFHKHPSNKKETVLVYDLGGGTFDAAIVECDPLANKKYVVLATGGDTKVGGIDWDNCLKKIVKNKTKFPSIVGEDGTDVPDESNQRIKYEREITHAKILLSSEEEATVGFKARGQSYAYTVTREEFEKASADLLEKTIDVIKTSTLPNYEKVKGYSKGTGIDHIDRIILVGGASQMPQVKKRLVAEFGRKIKPDNIVSESPQLAIACGAVLYNETNAVMRTNYTYGIKILKEGFKVTDNDPYLISNILKKGEIFVGPYVEQHRDKYKPVNDQQEIILVETYISDSSEDEIPLSEGKKVNQFEMKIKIPSGQNIKPTQMLYDYTFKVTRDNVIEITARDQFGNIAAVHKYTGDV